MTGGLAALPHAEVARRVSAGEADAPDAEAELCRRLWQRARLYGLKHLRDVTRAEDLAQQVTVTVVRALRDGRADDLERIERYVLGVCRNTAAAMRRSDRRAGELLGDVGDVPAAPAAAPWDGLAIDRLTQCCMRLDRVQQAVVLMSYVQWRSSAEIAESLDTTPGNVRVLRHRALAALRACMEGAP